MRKLGNRIKELRNERNLSLMQLEQALGISYFTLRRYEREETEPKLETWIKLADYFGVSVGYLQGIEAKTEPTSDLGHQKSHDAIWKGMAKTLRAASVGTIGWEEAYQDLKRYQRKSDELRFEEKQETQKHMFDLALQTFKRRGHNEK